MDRSPQVSVHRCVRPQKVAYRDNCFYFTVNFWIFDRPGWSTVDQDRGLGLVQVGTKKLLSIVRDTHNSQGAPVPKTWREPTDGVTKQWSPTVVGLRKFQSVDLFTDTYFIYFESHYLRGLPRLLPHKGSQTEDGAPLVEKQRVSMTMTKQ